MPICTSTVLILGGTREAAEIAQRLVQRGVQRVVSSLAGRTQEPRRITGEVRIGGFGGVDGLTTYLMEHGVEVLIDATHPFATEISANAGKAADRAGVRRVSLWRPAWRQMEEDRWTVVPTLATACDAIPRSARVFLALGSQYLIAFAERTDVTFIVRMVDPPANPLPLDVSRLILGTPGTIEQEAELFRSHGVGSLVCRNAGGCVSYAKIAAARRLKLPVIMIDRPSAPNGEVFETTDDLLTAIA